MNVRSHQRTGATRAVRKRRPDDALKRRYENAWDDTAPHLATPAPKAGLTRTARIVMLAPVFGALGAYIYFRRRR